MQKKLVPLMEQLDGVRKVNSADTVAKGLGRFNLLIAYISVSIIVLLFLVSVFLINTSVATGIRVRRSEISIMKYIGATNWFIRGPFLLEGIIIGVISSLLAAGITYFLYVQFVEYAGKQILVTLSSLRAPAAYLVINSIIILLAIGVGIGGAGSVVSMRRYLNK